MKSFSGLGIGLGLVFGCLLLALIAEIYYLLWWKKRVTSREVEVEEADYSNNYAKDLFHFICWKKPSSLQSNNNTQGCAKDREVQNGQEQDLEIGASKDLLKKAFGEETIEAELMHLHNLAGPPRFLFTIKEETKEDLESEDGKSHRSRKGSRTRSLSDLVLTVDTQLLGTPLASPHLRSPLSEAYFCHGFNPLFESSLDSQLNRFNSSPPPKFKFLRDAEEKLLKRLLEEAEKKGSTQNSVSVPVQDSGVQKIAITEDTEGSFLGFIVGKNKERPQISSSSSQVLPLASSPTTLIRPIEKKR